MTELSPCRQLLHSSAFLTKITRVIKTLFVIRVLSRSNTPPGTVAASTWGQRSTTPGFCRVSIAMQSKCEAGFAGEQEPQDPQICSVGARGHQTVKKWPLFEQTLLLTSLSNRKDALVSIGYWSVFVGPDSSSFNKFYPQQFQTVCLLVNVF